MVTTERNDLRKERDDMEMDFKEKISFMEQAYEGVIQVRH